MVYDLITWCSIQSVLLVCHNIQVSGSQMELCFEKIDFD